MTSWPAVIEPRTRPQAARFPQLRRQRSRWFRLNKAGAGNVAIDAAVNVQVSLGRDVALDGNVRAEHGKG
jgi:hypothetical protein